MDRPLSILYAVPFWPSLYAPFLFREIAWMKARGHRVAVLSTMAMTDGHSNVAAFGLADVPVHHFARRHVSDARTLRSLLAAIAAPPVAAAPSLRHRLRRSGVRQGALEWAELRRAVAFARRQRPDVIEAHWATEAAVLAVELKLALAAPLAVRMHGGDLYRSPSPDLPRIVGHADALCPVSAFLADLLRGERPIPHLPVVPTLAIDESRLHVQHHGLPIDQITAAARPEPEPLPSDAARSSTRPTHDRAIDRVTVVSVGRLSPEKRHADILDALAPLCPDRPGLGVTLIGGGPLEADLRQRAARLGIADRLTITGPLPFEQVLRRVARCDIYVQASDLEGFGMAPLEAAALGRPVVATRTGAHADIVARDRTGLLYDAGDTAALAAHLARLADDHATRHRMSDAAVEHVARHFDFEHAMLRNQSLLRRLANPTP